MKTTPAATAVPPSRFMTVTPATTTSSTCAAHQAEAALPAPRTREQFRPRGRAWQPGRVMFRIPGLGSTASRRGAEAVAPCPDFREQARPWRRAVRPGRGSSRPTPVCVGAIDVSDSASGGRCPFQQKARAELDGAVQVLPSTRPHESSVTTGSGRSPFRDSSSERHQERGPDRTSSGNSRRTSRQRLGESTGARPHPLAPRGRRAVRANGLGARAKGSTSCTRATSPWTRHPGQDSPRSAGGRAVAAAVPDACAPCPARASTLPVLRAYRAPGSVDLDPIPSPA